MDVFFERIIPRTNILLTCFYLVHPFSCFPEQSPGTVKFKFGLTSILGHFMSWSNNIKRCFIEIIDPHVQTERVRELPTSQVPSQKAGRRLHKQCCNIVL